MVADRLAREARADASDQQRVAAAARDQAAVALTAEAAAEDNTKQIQLQLTALDARVTDRGMVVTLGDLLFATGTANLDAGGNRHLAKLAAFLDRHPSRRAAIDGYTDSVSGSDYNLGLSQQRVEVIITDRRTSSN